MLKTPMYVFFQETFHLFGVDVTQRGGSFLITTITWGETIITTTTTTTTTWNGGGSNESTILTPTTKKASLEKGGLAGPI